MNPELLIALFDRISEAPDAVSRLRRFVLDLAVRGKLVEQDRNDEPASELLKHIPYEKDRIAKATGITQCLPSPINASETPFEVPHSWEWVRVGWVFKYDAGTKRSPRELVPDKWLLELEDIEKDTSVVETRLKVKDRDSRSTKSEFRAGDILYGKLRPYLNKVVVADEDGYSTTEIVAIRPLIPISSSYCCLAFRSPDFVAYVSRVGQGTKMPRLRTQDALIALFPLPPVAEQHRIVAKVDELMALCDQLEEIQRERETKRDRLTAASHFHLNDDANAEGSRRRAGFYVNHLQTLTSRPEQIYALREAILNLAVRGRLILQDSNDEPVSRLLERICAEQKRLIAAGAIPKSKVQTSSAPVELAFEPPKNWEPVSFGQLCNIVTSGSRGWAKYYSESGPRFIRAQNIRFGKLRLDDLACVNPPKKSEGTRTQVSQSDLLIVITGAGVTNPALLNRDLGEAYVSQHVALIKPTDTSLSPWLLLCLMAPMGGRAELVTRAYGAGKPGLNLDNIRSLPIPLPPLAEQDRILAKVCDLMKLCDQLESQLTTARSESQRLLEAVLYHALSEQDLSRDPGPNTFAPERGDCMKRMRLESRFSDSSAGSS